MNQKDENIIFLFLISVAGKKEDLKILLWKGGTLIESIWGCLDIDSDCWKEANMAVI